MTELNLNFEEMGFNLIPKMKCDLENCSTQKEEAIVVVKGCSEMVNLHSCRYPTYVVIAWMEYVIFNYMPGTHKYKDTFQTLKEILRASEESGYAWENPRLVRLLNL